MDNSQGQINGFGDGEMEWLGLLMIFVFAVMDLSLVAVCVAGFRFAPTVGSAWLSAIVIVLSSLGTLLGLAALCFTVALSMGAHFVRWRRKLRRRLRAAYGDQYDQVHDTLFNDLVRIDPFRRMYSLGGKERHYNDKYETLVLRILSDLERENPASPQELRRLMYESLQSDLVGNRLGDVGPPDRYDAMAVKAWAALHSGLVPGGEAGHEG